MQKHCRYGRGKGCEFSELSYWNCTIFWSDALCYLSSYLFWLISLSSQLSSFSLMFPMWMIIFIDTLIQNQYKKAEYLFFLLPYTSSIIPKLPSLVDPASLFYYSLSPITIIYVQPTTINGWKLKLTFLLMKAMPEQHASSGISISIFAK